MSEDLPVDFLCQILGSFSESVMTARLSSPVENPSTVFDTHVSPDSPPFRETVAVLQPHSVEIEGYRFGLVGDAQIVDSATDLITRILSRTSSHQLVSSPEGVIFFQRDEILARARLHSTDPVRGTCTCDDFRRNGLGFCSHLAHLLLTGHEPSGSMGWDGRWLGAHDTDARMSDDEVSDALRGESDEFRRCRALHLSDIDAVLAHLSSLKRRLFDYQQEGVEFLLRRVRAMLADDMGLGKTTQAIAACHALYRSKRVRVGMIIVPSPLKPQWVREWKAVSDVPIQDVVGDNKRRRRTYETHRGGFLVVSYDQLRVDVEALRDLWPDVVVLDEAQKVKNEGTVTLKCLRHLDPLFRFALTGTPFENRPGELATILGWVVPGQIPPAWWVGARHRRESAGEVDGLRNLEELRSRLAPHVLRRSRLEVLDQLPSRRDEYVQIPMLQDQLDAHDALQRPIARAAASTDPQVKDALVGLLNQQRALCFGTALFDDELRRRLTSAPFTPEAAKKAGMPKLEALRELVQQLVGQGRKTIIFSEWVSAIEWASWAIHPILDAFDKRAEFFTGHPDHKAQREVAVRRFVRRESSAVMFLTDAGGSGLNLQAASACINLELPWNPAVLEQRISRIFRLGQTRPVDVYNFVSIQGCEGKIAEILRNKAGAFDEILAGSADEFDFVGHANFMLLLPS